MMLTPPESDEETRVAALRSYGILDTEREAAFDRIVRVASIALDVPVAKITLIDRNRAWTKSVVGEERREELRRLTFCDSTIAMDAPLVVEDAASHARFGGLPSVVGPPRYRFYAGVPLRSRDGRPIGTLCCLDYRPRSVAAGRIAALQDLGQLVVDALEMRLVATRDALTGVMTRLAFLDAARRDVALAIRHGRPLSIVLVGFDAFTALRDSRGHAAADQILRRFAGLCRDRLRSSDCVGLTDDDRFALLLRETSARDGGIVADRLRDAMDAETFEASTGGWSVATSAGLVGVGPQTCTVETLLSAAGEALFAAVKDGGRRTISHERLSLRRA